MGGGWCRNKNTDLNWLDSSKSILICRHLKIDPHRISLTWKQESKEERIRKSEG